MQNVTVADDRLVFLASLHPARLHGPFERQQASAGFAAHPQCASGAAKRFVARIEECIFLESPALEWRCTRGQDGRPRFTGGFELQFDFSFDHVTSRGANGLQTPGDGFRYVTSTWVTGPRL